MDCSDPHQMASFYSKLLEVEIAYDVDNFAAVKLENIWLSFQKVVDYTPPTWPSSTVPQQLHLDFAVEDLVIAERVALEAGATKMNNQPSPERWLVFSDPSGHPFCLSTLLPE
ncbi:MAG: VOC family protein [Actinomycetota bacterium]|jgi:predicted enzyme related to lactoylglutathione lyase|nr:VOC family protein [Actinomycetota bacterium]